MVCDSWNRLCPPLIYLYFFFTKAPILLPGASVRILRAAGLGAGCVELLVASWQHQTSSQHRKPWESPNCRPGAASRSAFDNKLLFITVLGGVKTTTWRGSSCRGFGFAAAKAEIRGVWQRRACSEGCQPYCSCWERLFPTHPSCLPL